MKRVWVWMNGTQDWAYFGSGKPVVRDDYLLLFDSQDKEVGRIALAALQRWGTCEPGIKAEWVKTES